MTGLKDIDVYQAAYGIGQAQGAGPLPQSFVRTALFALSRMPDVSIGETMKHYRAGLDDYWESQKAMTGALSND